MRTPGARPAVCSLEPSHAPAANSVLTRLLLILILVSIPITFAGCSGDNTSSSFENDNGIGGETAAAVGGMRLSLDDIFANVVPEIFDRTYEDFEVRGEEPVVTTKYTRFFYSIKGPKMWAYCNRNLADPCDCDCSEGIDPCLSPGSQTILREARQTVQLFVPNSIDFNDPPYMYIDKSGSHDGETESEKEVIAKLLARKGVVAAIFTEEDLFPVNGVPVLPISEQFGFPGPASFQRDGCKHWLRTRDPLNLTAEDLRIDDRYQNGQSYVLTGTFFRRLMADYFGNDPQAVAWADSVQILYAGGSKAAAGAYTAAGIDPRAVAVRTSGFLEFDTEHKAAAHRFETDWRECPENCPTDDTCSELYEGSHRWYRYTNWLRLNKDNLPSYWDTYRLRRNMPRYENLMFLEIAGTHDWINPLGSDEDFWQSVDGLVDGMIDPTEERWNYRLIRRINGDHGTSYTVGRTAGGKDVRGDQLLLFRALMHLSKGKALPRMEGAGIDTSGDPGVDPWTVSVRLSDLPAVHDPLVEEQYKIHLAFSDDRDFRRCTPPIRCRGDDEIPCIDNGICRDPFFDDNKDEEDKFIKIIGADADIVVDGEMRHLTFQPPVEVLAFSPDPPLVACIVEVRIDDSIPFNIKDDWVLHTDVMFANEDLYPPFACCPP